MATQFHTSILLRLLFVFGSVILLFLLIVGGKQFIEGNSFKYPGHPKTTFGVTSPVGFEISGLDVSRHQGTIDWPKAANMISNGKRLEFVFIKATEGITLRDNRFISNWEEAGKAGFVRGAYHYFHPTRHPERQAANFIRFVKLSVGDLPPVVDVEIRGGKSKKEFVMLLKEYITMIEHEYRVRPILYTSLHLYTTLLKDDFNSYPLWISCYFEQDRFEKECKHRLYFWQYTEKGKVDGISGKADINVFNGSRAQLDSLCMH